MTMLNSELAELEREPVAAAGRPAPAATVPGAVAAAARSAPGRVAVGDEKALLTFGELDRGANRLAAFLSDAGAGPETCVALFLDRSAEFVSAALAVLKAGAAYLPVDPSTPPDRAAFILADAAVPLVLTHRGKAAGLPAGPWRVVELDGRDAPAVSAFTDAPPAREPDPDSLAYVVYTSGSTGRPKGVEITHANLNNLVEWHRGALGITPDDRASQVAGLGFDATAWEVWPHLAAGASVHVADDVTRRSPSLLRDWLLAEKISVCFAPTLTAELLLDESWPADAPLRFLLTGGEALKRRPRPGLPFRLVNCYGPTECTVLVTAGEVPPAPGDHPPPPIGGPIPNVRAAVLDDGLKPVPVGEPGELCFTGASVGRGYRNNPGLTADRFVTVEGENGRPVRAYRTGDRARQLPGGDLEFLGRVDDQVKVRGYRIEPGEVVSVLCGHPGVSTAAVAPRGEGLDRSLAAYVVPAKGAALSAGELRAHLGAKLPDYMVPSHFVALDALPLTANGKLDRAALPAPAASNLLPEGAAAGGPAASSGEESRIAALVAGLLGREEIGRDENFFMVGGHSMLGVQLVAKVRDAFGVKLTLRQLFNAPTIAALAAEVARLGAPNAQAR